MTTIRDVLRGTTTGVMQTVGFMQIIPLIAETQYPEYAPPTQLKVSTSNYGVVNILNAADSLTIVPANTAFLTKQRAQNHAIMAGGKIGKKGTETFNDAACIQASQGGYISSEDSKLQFLPLALREFSLSSSGKSDYSKLWPSIQKFQDDYGVRNASRGHLEYFYEQFSDELALFAGQFEPVPNQVGAIVILDGNIVGVERVPSSAYWAAVWQPLLRDCYGSAAKLYAKEMGTKKPNTVLAIDESKVNSFKTLKTQLKAVEVKEEELVKKQVRAMIDNTMVDVSTQTSRAGRNVLQNDQFIGQVIRKTTPTSAVVYASFITRKSWDKNASDWHKEERFEI